MTTLEQCVLSASVCNREQRSQQCRVTVSFRHQKWFAKGNTACEKWHAPGCCSQESLSLHTVLRAEFSPRASANANTWSESEGLRIVKEVRHKLAGLTNYDVFDSLRFAVRGNTIVLEGFASRPTLKSDAENAIKDIAGVQGVTNEIKVLPYSPNDDRIRVDVYRRIYGQPALRRYTGSPVGFGRFPSVALAAGGITNDPPLGYHAIHIIVDNGNVTLKGVVDSEADASIANMQANSAPGVFSVASDLLVQSVHKKQNK